MDIPLTFPKHPSINAVIVHVWCVFSGKLSNTQYQTKNAELIKILVMNADTSISENEYGTGSNIVIGGNVLGRGVTFPKLQTLYYTRTAKKPQADTMWQHSRMFGYDRDPGLMEVYLTQSLYKIFSDINAGIQSSFLHAKIATFRPLDSPL